VWYSYNGFFFQFQSFTGVARQVVTRVKCNGYMDFEPNEAFSSEKKVESFPSHTTLQIPLLLQTLAKQNNWGQFSKLLKKILGKRPNLQTS